MGAEETQEQKDERMSWELFPDIRKTDMTAKQSASEDGMIDAASDWTKAWRIIAQALKELRCPDCDGNARAIIARLAQQNMLIVGVDNVKD